MSGRIELGTGCWMLVTGCWIAGCWIAGYWMLVTGCWIMDAGCWIMDAGCWIMDMLRIGEYVAKVPLFKVPVPIV
jgi:hypothetical protein